MKSGLAGWVGAWRGRLRTLERETYVLFFACRNERTPWYAKLTAAVVVAYAFSPIDLIPDFIPVLGLLDDVVLIPLGVVLVRWMVPDQVLSDCRVRAECSINNGKPVYWTVAVVIVGLWVVAAYFTYRLVRDWFSRSVHL